MNNEQISPTPTADTDQLTPIVEQTEYPANADAQETDNTQEAADEAIATDKAKINYALEIKEQKDKYMRLLAEFDTAKRRMARERIELTQTAAKDTISELLPVLDDFERASKAAANDANLKGFELIYQKLKNILEQKGLKPMNAHGTAFDADLHEAIAEIPVPTGDLKGKVIDEVEKGYYLHQTIIRYAKVVVGK